MLMGRASVLTRVCVRETTLRLHVSHNLHFSVECLARGTVTEAPNPLWLEGGLWLGCARLCGAGSSWECGSGLSSVKHIDSVTNWFKQGSGCGGRNEGKDSE